MPDTPVYSLRFRIVAGLVVALAVGLFTLAYLSFQDGSEDPILQSGDADEFVDDLIPQRNAQVVQQQTVGIDLIPTWTGVLVIDGTEIPQDQLQVTQEIGLIQYTPNEGQAVEQLLAGTNTVDAIVWPLAESRETAARTISWTFEVV
jgi:hypothetical protein